MLKFLRASDCKSEYDNSSGTWYLPFCGSNPLPQPPFNHIMATTYKKFNDVRDMHAKADSMHAKQGPRSIRPAFPGISRKDQTAINKIFSRNKKKWITTSDTTSRSIDPFLLEETSAQFSWKQKTKKLSENEARKFRVKTPECSVTTSVTNKNLKTKQKRKLENKINKNGYISGPIQVTCSYENLEVVNADEDTVTTPTGSCDSDENKVVIKEPTPKEIDFDRNWDSDDEDEFEIEVGEQERSAVDETLHTPPTRTSSESAPMTSRPVYAMWHPTKRVYWSNLNDEFKKTAYYRSHPIASVFAQYESLEFMDPLVAMYDLLRKSGVMPKENTFTLPMVRPFVSFMVFLYQLYKSDGYVAISAAFFQWINGLPQFVMDFVTSHDYLATIYESFKQGISYESGPSYISFLRRIVNSGAVQAIKELLINLAAFELAPERYKRFIKFSLGKPKDLPLSAFIDSIAESLDRLADIISSWYYGTPLSELLTSKDPFHNTLDSINELRLHANHLYTGLPVEGRMEAREFCKKASHVIATAEHILTRLRKGMRRNAMQEARDDMIRAIANARALIGSKTKFAPIGLVFEGLPGIGKSKMMPHTLRLHCKVKGREFSEDLMYTRVPSSDYWEGLIPEAHPYCMCPEVGAVNMDLAKHKGDERLVEVLNLIDDMPFSCNMAALESKGKVFANFEVVCIDTNNKDMNLAVLMHAPAAIYRRFYYVTFSVKPQYRKEGGMELDPIKSFAAGGDMLDRWNITVTKRVAVSTTEYREIKLLVDADIYEYSDFMTDFFTKHEHLIAKMKENFVDYDISDYVGKSKPEQPLDIDVDEEKVLYENENKPDIELAKYNARRSAGTWTDWYQGTPAFKLVQEAISWEKTLKRKYPFPFIVTECCFDQIVIWLFAFLNSSTESLSSVQYSCITMFILLSFYKGPYFAFFWTTSLLVLLLWYYTTRTKFYRTIRYFQAKASDSRRLLQYFMYGSDSHSEDVRWRDLLFRRLPNHESVAKGIALTTLAIATFCIWKRFSGNDENESSQVTPDISTEGQIDRIEQLVGSKPATQRINIANSQLWNTVDYPQYTQQMNCSLEVISNHVARNQRTVIVCGGKSESHTLILGIFGNYALINNHAMRGGTHLKVYPAHVTSGKGYNVSHLGKAIVVGSDVSMIEIDGVRFSDIRPYFLDKMVENVSGYIKSEKVFIEVIRNISVDADGVHEHHPVAYTYNWKAHAKGECGSALLCETPRGFAIAGIHFAGARDTSSFAIPVLRDSLTAPPSDMPIYSESAIMLSTRAPDAKSPFRHVELHRLDYRGQLQNPVTLPKKSEVRKNSLSTIYEEILEMKCEDDQGPLFGAPIMRPGVYNGEYLSPYNICLEALNGPRAMVDPEITERVVKRMCDRFSNLGKFAPLTLEQALNGASNDAYLRSMNFSTSAGFGLKGKKRDYAVIDEDGKKLLKSEVIKRVEFIIGCYLEGKASPCIYKASLKDEVRSRKKIETGNTRVFYVGDFAQTVVDRMFLAPLLTTMQEKSETFCTAIGVNMHSGADGLVRRLLGRSKFFIEFDYEKFDIRQAFRLKRAVSRVIVWILKQGGYNEYAIKVVVGVLNDNMFITIEMLMQLFTVCGLTPSGMFGTAEKNTLYGLFIMLYAWEVLKPGMDFFEWVVLLIYGDDVVGSVDEEVIDDFNNITIAKVVESHLGLKVTPADKASEFTKYLTIDQISFLKRKFVYSDCFGRWLAPLDKSSLLKSGCYYIPSKFVTEFTRDCDAATSFLYEWYLHVEAAKFKVDRMKLVKALGEKYEMNEDIINKNLQTYEQINVKMNFDPPQKEGIMAQATDSSLNGVACRKTPAETGHPVNSMRVSEIFTEAFSVAQRYLPPKTMNWRNINTYWSIPLGDTEDALCDSRQSKLRQDSFNQQQEYIISQLEQEVTDLKSIIPKSEVLRYRTIEEIRDFDILTIKSIGAEYDETIRRLERIHDIQCDIDHKRYLMRATYLHYESETFEASKDVAEHVDTRETLTDMGGFQPYSISSGFTQPSSNDIDTSSKPSDFFSRPIRIYSSEISPGSPFLAAVKVWQVYTSNPSVRAKLRNYSYLKANMHVRVTVSGTPFHQGRLLVSYQPYAVHNEALNGILANSTHVNNYSLLNCFLSQAPGSFSMDVRANQPVDTDIPFILPANMIRLFNATSPVSDATAFADTDDMGELYISSFGRVKAVNASSTPVYIKIYAWLSDVKLGAPTNTRVQITTESLRSPIEYESEFKTGPIETVASNAIKVFDIVSPILPKWALPSRMGLTAIQKVSALFGWSKPPIEVKSMVVKNMGYSNGANGIGWDSTQRLVLDPHQEMTVDPRCVGVNSDDMSIKEIGQRESFIGSYDWEYDTNLNTQLMTIKVTPQVEVTSIILPSDAIHQPSAASFAVRPFAFWRSDITYRFEVVCSNFHRGKIAFIYEPNATNFNANSTVTTLNKQYIQIIDIQETTEFELTVFWSNQRQWCKTAQSPHLVGFDNSFQNGVIYAVPFVELQSPDSAVGVKINVYMRCNNLQVNGMRDSLPSQMRVFDESFESKTIHYEAKDVLPVSHFDLNEQTSTGETSCIEFFGEQPLSFRTCLKRYQREKHQFYAIANGTLANFHSNIAPTPVIYPSTQALNHTPYLFDYLRYAYLGWRGGLRRRVYVDALPGGLISVSMMNTSGSDVNPAAIAAGDLGSLLTGSVIMNATPNWNVEFETPCYTNNLFLLAFNRDQTAMNASEVVYFRRYSLRFVAPKENMYLTNDLSTAEDFTFLRFQGAPYYTTH